MSSPAFNFYGITPSLSWTHKRVESNVDWLYTYQQNEVSLKLVKRFLTFFPLAITDFAISFGVSVITMQQMDVCCLT
ncbi:surface lipoprotein assembly modifier [Vibrio sinaloensis]|nr:surface lipoprotein assembly modifier [Vibrio sinaloensis]